jgi:hypothetical protein
MLSLALCIPLLGMEQKDDRRELRKMSHQKFAHVRVVLPCHAPVKIDAFGSVAQMHRKKNSLQSYLDENSKRTNLSDLIFHRRGSREESDSFIFRYTRHGDDLTTQIVKDNTIICTGIHEHPTAHNNACMSPTQPLVAIGQEDATIDIIDLAKKSVVISLKGVGKVGHALDKLTDCCFSPDGRLLLVQRLWAPLIIYDTTTFKPIFRLAIAREMGCYTPYFSKSGKKVKALAVLVKDDEETDGEKNERGPRAWPLSLDKSYRARVIFELPEQNQAAAASE